MTGAITRVDGGCPGPRALVISGIHGGEYLAIAAARRLIETVKPADVRGTLTIVCPANADGFWQRREYINPADGKNLGSAFPGSADGSPTERVAARLAEMMRESDFVLDMHSGDIHELLTPFAVVPSVNPAVGQASLEAARALGFEYIVRLPNAEIAAGCAASLGVPAVMAEMGGGGRWSERQAEKYCAAAISCLRAAGSLRGRARQGSARELRGYAAVKAERDCCWIARARAGEVLKAGELVGFTEDFCGKNRREYRAPCDCVVLYTVSALAVAAGGSLYALGEL